MLTGVFRFDTWSFRPRDSEAAVTFSFRAEAMHGSALLSREPDGWRIKGISVHVDRDAGLAD
jgi:hypothetical protein